MDEIGEFMKEKIRIKYEFQDKNGKNLFCLLE